MNVDPVESTLEQQNAQSEIKPTGKAWYKRRPIITFVLGLLLAFGLVAAFHIVRNALAEETKLSCHQPTTQSTQLPYCVYYKNHQILIGANNDRGTRYAVPYKLKDVSVSWDNNTDALTVTMPGTKLVIQSSEYVDRR